MSRSILLPVLGLAAIILYGTTQAARPTAEEVARNDTREALEPQRLPSRATPAPPPPPAPRLRSEIEAEATARTDSIRQARQRVTDTVAAGSRSVGADARTAPLQGDSARAGRPPAQPPNTPIP